MTFKYTVGVPKASDIEINYWMSISLSITEIGIDAKLLSTIFKSFKCKIIESSEAFGKVLIK